MSVRIIEGDCLATLRTLPDGSAQCCVTSPPYYGLRDYGVAGQIGLEDTPDAYVSRLVDVFREVRRVLADDGVAFCNLGDSYASTTGSCGASLKSTLASKPTATKAAAQREIGSWRRGIGEAKPKDLLGIPWMVAFALRADGWWLRSDIIWQKPNPMPESVKGSHFTRHMVTIADYERLSGLPYSDERAGDDWASDMPSLSEVEAPRGKAPLRAERERQGDHASARRSARREGKAQDSVSVRCRAGSASEVCEDSQRQGKGSPEGRSLLRVGEGQAKSPRTASGDKGHAAAHCAKTARVRCVCEDCQDGSEEAQRLCQEEGCAGGRRAVHGGDVDCAGGAAQASVPLLRPETGADPGSCNPGEQGRDAYRGEHRPRVPVMQLGKRGPDSSDLLVGCPGCEICAKHHGYIFHLSAGRPTSAHEHVFLLTKSSRYFYDADAIREDHARLWDATNGGNMSVKGAHKRHDGVSERGGSYPMPNPLGRNARNVWTIATQPCKLSHFATMPPDLAERCIKAGSKPGDTVIDPFGGAGTTGLVADRLGRNAILCELNPEYAALARERITGDCPMFAETAA